MNRDGRQRADRPVREGSGMTARERGGGGRDSGLTVNGDRTGGKDGRGAQRERTAEAGRERMAEAEAADGD